MRNIFLIALLLLVLDGSAQQFLLSPQLGEAWQEISRLRLQRAEVLIAQEKNIRKDNILADVFTLQLLFQKALASGSADDEQNFQQAKGQLQKQLSGLNTSNPWQHWALGYSGMISLMLRMRAGQQWQVAMELRRTYTRIESAYTLHPDFIPNQLSHGLMQVALGSAPEQVSMVLRMASFNADSQEGIAKLMKIFQLPESHPFAFMRSDAAIMLGMASRAMQMDAATKDIMLSKMSVLDRRNLMLQYTLAYLLMRDGRNEEALKVLNNRPVSNEYTEFPLIDYLLAEALLRKGSHLAEAKYRLYIRESQVTMYHADAQRKLGWIALLEGDTATYLSQMKICRASSGNSERDEDARREAMSRQLPHPVLLLARLRFDGGYYAEARTILDKSSPLFSEAVNSHRLEFIYRRARVAEAEGQLDNALRWYSETYQLGQHAPDYFAANAALRLGDLFAQLNNHTEAALWYNRCLAAKPDSYRSSIHAAAKTGLRRIGK